MIHNTINALGRYIGHKAEVYEQTDTDISQPKKVYLVVLFAIMLGLMTVEDLAKALTNNKYLVFTFELLAFAAFVIVVGALLFIVFPLVLGIGPN